MFQDREAFWNSIAEAIRAYEMDGWVFAEPEETAGILGLDAANKQQRDEPEKKHLRKIHELDTNTEKKYKKSEKFSFRTALSPYTEGAVD